MTKKKNIASRSITVTTSEIDADEVIGKGSPFKRGYLITIDGPAGAGKSTVAKILATRLSYLYLNTGALYRAVAWKALQEGVSTDNGEALCELIGKLKLEIKGTADNMVILVDGQDVSPFIRTEEISIAASQASRHAAVRKALLNLQRALGAEGGIVAEGRDTGTVVFPEADFKFYLDASIEERIKRRYDELVARQEQVIYGELEEQIRLRDKQDQEREVAPLKPAPNAVIIDSSSMSAQQCADKILEIISQGDF